MVTSYKEQENGQPKRLWFSDEGALRAGVEELGDRWVIQASENLALGL